MEETPAWAVSRRVQALLLVGVAWLIGGIVALYQVRLDPPGLRPYVLALLVLAACILVSVLLRSEHDRRRTRSTSRRLRGN